MAYIVLVLPTFQTNSPKATLNKFIVSQALLHLPYMRVRVINPRHACTARVTVVAMSVCLSVCLSVSGASVYPENGVMYSAGNEGQNL